MGTCKYRSQYLYMLKNNAVKATIKNKPYISTWAMLKRRFSEYMYWIVLNGQNRDTPVLVDRPTRSARFRSPIVSLSAPSYRPPLAKAHAPSYREGAINFWRRRRSGQKMVRLKWIMMSSTSWYTLCNQPYKIRVFPEKNGWQYTFLHQIREQVKEVSSNVYKYGECQTPIKAQIHKLYQPTLWYLRYLSDSAFINILVTSQ